MNIVNRIGKYKQSGREWYQRAVNAIEYITVHHTGDGVTGTNDEILQKEANAHIGNGWPGISYHFFITKDGTIYQLNNFSDVTWHDSINWDSIGICLQGYFHPNTNEKPTEAQLKSLRELLDELCNNHPEFPADQGTVVGHRERSSTACLPLDITYILTDKGFKKLEHVVKEDRVAQFNSETKEITFIEPKNIINPFIDEIIYNDYIHQTSSHETLRYTSKGNLLKQPWNIMVDKIRDIMIPTSGQYYSNGLKIDEDELKYIVAVQADGHYSRDNRIERIKKGKKYNVTPYEIGVEFHLKKERKIKRLIGILDKIKADYSIRDSNDNTKKITIKNKSKYNRSWCEKYLENKCFTEIFLHLNKEQADIFLEEIKYWDGKSTADNICYSSNQQKNIDIIQGIATLNGYRAKSKENEISITNRKYQTINSSYKKRETVVGCIEVENGNIIVRQNGFVFITGNCPGDHLIGYVTDYRNKKGSVDWGKSSTQPQKPQTDVENKCDEIENRLNDAIRLKDDKIKTIYLGLPNADKQQNDPNYHLQAISAYILKMSSSISSIKSMVLLIEKSANDIKNFIDKT